MTELEKTSKERENEFDYSLAELEAEGKPLADITCIGTEFVKAFAFNESVDDADDDAYYIWCKLFRFAQKEKEKRFSELFHKYGRYC